VEAATAGAEALKNEARRDGPAAARQAASCVRASRPASPRAVRHASAQALPLPVRKGDPRMLRAQAASREGNGEARAVRRFDSHLHVWASPEDVRREEGGGTLG